MTSKRLRVSRVSCVALAFPLLTVVGCLSSSSNVGTDGGSPASDANAPPQDGSTSLGDGSSDGGGEASSTCAPANVQGYIPKWTPPAKPTSSCTQAQLDSYGACLDANDVTSAACAPWYGLDASANSSCKACVTDSKETDPAWGPIVDVGTSGSLRQLNVSGCLAILTKDNGSGCAGYYQAFQECEAAACADNCQGASPAARSSCITAADTGGCSNYLGPASCINSEAGAAASACFASGTFGQEFTALAAVFCLDVDGG